MITPEEIKEKYDIFHEYFNFKDFIGLSALIFGLLLAHAPVDKIETQAIQPSSITTPMIQEAVPETPPPAPVQEKTVKKKKPRKKASKRAAAKPSQKQRVTAAHND